MARTITGEFVGGEFGSDCGAVCGLVDFDAGKNRRIIIQLSARFAPELGLV
jgi:hypothetical protein